MPFALTAASCVVAMLGQVALFVGLVALVTSHPDDEEFHISTRMWQCFNDEKVLFNGSCQTLLTQNICNSKELLVFIHVDDEKTMIGCRKCHCCEFSLSFFWSKDRTCHSQAKAPQLCNSKDRELYQNYFDEGECRCRTKPKIMLELNETDLTSVDKNIHLSQAACYEPFQKGPCISGYTLQPDQVNRNGICAPDPCLKENSALKSTDSPFVKLFDSCYQLGTKGPCRINDTLVGIDPINLNVVCINSGLSIVQLSSCKEKENISKCTQEVMKPDSGQEFHDKILSSMRIKRNKREHRRNINITL